jgi:hypothetical protein
MGRLIEGVLAVWRIRRLGRSGPKARWLLLLEIALALVALIFPIIGQAVLTVDIFTLRVNLVEKLAWIFLVWVMPVAGPLLYLLVGPRRVPASTPAPLAPPRR